VPLNAVFNQENYCGAGRLGQLNCCLLHFSP